MPEFFKKLPSKNFRTPEDENRENARMEEFFTDCVNEITEAWSIDRKPVETRHFHILDNFNKFFSLVDSFGDEESRRLYLKLLKLKLALFLCPTWRLAGALAFIRKPIGKK
ncbi:MAG: hypothetical protein K2H64_03065 [Desulfovibrio sp.]|nr:hypothetical protein [Desulfovibrio sp.]